MTNKTDYKDTRINLHDKLPEVYHSDTELSITENLFNRFLTKTETVKSSGVIGQPFNNKSIREHSLHRQTYQLQPLINAKIGTTDHINSWYDLLNELEKIGVNVEEWDKWGNTLKFNWVPPIDLDKLIHYNDYYWYDENNPNSRPEYITIQSPDSAKLAHVNMYENLIRQYGQLHNITRLDIENQYEHKIESINHQYQRIRIVSDISEELTPGGFFEIYGTSDNNGIYQILSYNYDDITNKTEIFVDATLNGLVSDDNSGLGTFKFKLVNAICLNGDVSQLFQSNFEIYFTQSDNLDISNKSNIVQNSYYISSNDETIIILVNKITYPILTTGAIDIGINKELVLSTTDCSVSGLLPGNIESGWDTTPWDDNPSSPIWGGNQLPGDFENFVNSITHPNPPIGPGSHGQIWRSTNTNLIYQFNSELQSWITVVDDAVSLLDSMTGTNKWDSILANNCLGTYDSTALQWMSNNKWLHKNDVPNFNIAKQANLPIIEYINTIELNNWINYEPIWHYRSDVTSDWIRSDVSPTIMELSLLTEWTLDTNDTIVFDEQYGDLTPYLKRGNKFSGFGIIDVFEVLDSVYKEPENAIGPKVTYVKVNRDVLNSPLITNTGNLGIRPLKTSQNDTWKGYDIHWAFLGYEAPVPTSNQTFVKYDFEDLIAIHPFAVDNNHIVTLDGKYGFNFIEFKFIELDSSLATSTEFELREFQIPSAAVPPNMPPLRSRVLTGTHNVHVFRDGILQTGKYEEIEDSQGALIGIRFLKGFGLSKSDISTTVKIQIGSDTVEGWGFDRIREIRTTTDDLEFATHGKQRISLTSNRHVPQLKTHLNQYPAFDVFDIIGQSNNSTSAIFGYKESQVNDINVNVGLRIEHDAVLDIYTFDQKLMETENSILSSFRDYNNVKHRIWINDKIKEIKFWNNDSLTWTLYDEVIHNGTLVNISGIISKQPPTAIEYFLIKGRVWYDEVDKILKQYDGNDWVDVDIDTYILSEQDPSLQTVWKKGLNNEEYIPAKVDWKQRSLQDYEEEKQSYISNRVDNLLYESNVSVSEAILIAEQDWLNSQRNEFSSTGEWIGDWEIPEPLIYNNQHENRKYIRSDELYTHFNSIIELQERIPGFSGPARDMFHMLANNERNYGVGGLIKEYNNAYDLLISSLFVNNITPISVIEFAKASYNELLDVIKQLFFDNVSTFLIEAHKHPEQELTTLIINSVIDDHTNNEYYDRLFGDSTTFNEITNQGMANWIATLPYLGIEQPVKPIKYGNIIRHHDGHYSTVNGLLAVESNMIKEVCLSQDSRVDDTLGKIKQYGPPNSASTFANEFETEITNRQGVYWLDLSTNSFYELNILYAGLTHPSNSVDDGILWFDTTPNQEVLRVKQTINGIVFWNPAPNMIVGEGKLYDGATVEQSVTSAWKQVNVADILASTILEVEQRLYQNVPQYKSLKVDYNVDFSDTQSTFNDNIKQAFFKFAKDRNVDNPLSNSLYKTNDPWTWNYYHSTIGSSIKIIEVDSTNNSFVVEGNQVPLFDQCATTSVCPGSPISFYVKNTEHNNGKWNTIVSTITTPSAVYNSNTNTTSVYVDKAVTADGPGLLYIGTLPSNNNTGAESAGNWASLYEQYFGTPYPNYEPWVLQGYKSKPEWWDNEYKNDNPKKWGDRIWKYKHGIEIFSSDPNTNVVTILGDFANELSGMTTIIFEDTGTNGIDGTYTVVSVTYNQSTNVTSITVQEPIIGTVNSGFVRIALGMWENIRIGIIPPGRTYPNGVVSVSGDPSIDRLTHNLNINDLPKYNYFAVNISNSNIVDYAPDSLFPPYVDGNLTISTKPSHFKDRVRSIYTNFNIEVVSPGADFEYGELGHVETMWRLSTSYKYDKLISAYKSEPLKIGYATFGFDVSSIDHLQIDKDTQQTIAHTRISFHGELKDNKIVKINGLNQWYVNANRSIGYDMSYSDFRELWCTWKTLMSYQYDSYIDPESVKIRHALIDLTTHDYQINNKISTGVLSESIESLKISIDYSPPQIARYDNQSEWKFTINNTNEKRVDLEYYDVHRYPCLSNLQDNSFSINTFKVTGFDHLRNAFTVNHNQLRDFRIGLTIEITNSNANNGTFTINNVEYNSVTDQTTIYVDRSIDYDTTTDSLAIINYREVPWETGEVVYIDTDQSLPIPLQQHTPYYVIKLDNRTVQLALSKSDALAGLPIAINTLGYKNMYICTVSSTFKLPTISDTTWYHYAIDYDNVIRTSLPDRISGIQTIISIVDGYDAKLKTNGWEINYNSKFVDEDIPGRVVGWQVELDKFIQQALNSRNSINSYDNKFEFSVNYNTSILTFIDNNSTFDTGTKVRIYSSSGVYDQPLNGYTDYYIIRLDFETFQLAATYSDAIARNAISITDNPGTRDQYVLLSNDAVNLASIMINPFKRGIWFNTPKGIVADVINGPDDDITKGILVYDIFGNPIPNSDIRVNRLDQVTQILYLGDSNNGIGGLTVFVDYYENVLQFNNYTDNNNLIYDTYLGLYVKNFFTEFNRIGNSTQRPNVGGYYLTSNIDEPFTLSRNIEASVDDLRYMYDTYTNDESLTLTKGSRDLVGYSGPVDYLDNLGLNEKTQFLFWKEQIQHVGAKNALYPITNSKKLLSASIDDFWTVQIAEYGSSKEKEYPELFLRTEDTIANDTKFQFASDLDVCEGGYAITTYDNDICGYAFPDSGTSINIDTNFTLISTVDDSRWYNYPSLTRMLQDNGGMLYFNNAPFEKFKITVSKNGNVPTYNYGDGWIDATDTSLTFRRFVGKYFEFPNGQVHGGMRTSEIPPGSGSKVDLLAVRHNLKADSLHIITSKYDNDKIIHLDPFQGDVVKVSDNVGLVEYFPYTNSVKIYKNGVELTLNKDFSEAAISAGNLYGDSIYFTEEIQLTDEIVIIIGKSTLVDGYHYINLNSEIVQILTVELFDAIDGVEYLEIWGMMADVNSHAPAALIDIKDGNYISDIQYWDPARGYHYYNAINSVDLFDTEDPAAYTNEFNQNAQQSNGIISPTIPQDIEIPVKTKPWGDEKIGTVWVDESELGYMPYYDNVLMPNVNDRSNYWGHLAEWSNMHVYQWVKSDVLPAEWDDLAAIEYGNTEIPNNVRKSGRVKKSYYLFDEVNNTWVPADDIHTDLDVLIEGVQVIDKYNFNIPLREFIPNYIDVYINGKLKHSDIQYSNISGTEGTIVLTDIKVTDRIHIVNKAFIDDLTRDSMVEEGFALAYTPYTENDEFDQYGNKNTYYYFWVENVEVKQDRDLTCRQAATTMVDIPTAFMVFQGLQKPRTVTIGNRNIELPERYVQLILRGLRGHVDADNKFIIRLTNNQTLRDKLTTLNNTSLELKTLHTEWKMFRRNQQQHIDRWMWDRITESIIGHKITDSSKIIPSLELQLYDEKYNTNLRYGWKHEGQALTDGTLAKQTIYNYLLDSSREFKYVNVGDFLKNHNMDSEESVINFMDVLYNTFPANYVNDIFFEVLYDALSLQDKYDGLIKTSMVALHGVIPLNVNGVND